MVEIVEIAGLEEVPTSHPGIVKRVLAAAGKYPEGKMLGLEKRAITGAGKVALVPQPNEMLLVIPSEGRVRIGGKDAEEHDLVTVREAVAVECEGSCSFYVLKWCVA